MNGCSGGFGGTMVRASRLPEILVLGTSAWRQSSTAKISEYKGKRRGDFSAVFPKNTTRTLYGEKPYIESEKRETLKNIKRRAINSSSFYILYSGNNTRCATVEFNSYISSTRNIVVREFSTDINGICSTCIN